MERISIIVNGWDKHQRTGVKKPTWFAVSNNLFDDPDFADFKPLEFHTLVYIFQMASRKNASRLDIVYLHASRYGIDRELMDLTLEKLERLKIVTIVGNGHVQNLLAHSQKMDTTDRQTDKQTDIQAREVFEISDQNEPLGKATQVTNLDDHRTPPPITTPIPQVNEVMKFENRSKFLFSEVIALWPKPVQKTKAIEKLSRDIGTQDQYDQLMVATQNAVEYYTKTCENLNFWPSFTTFLEDWEKHAKKIAIKPVAEFKGRIYPSERSHTSRPAEAVLNESAAYAQKLEEEAPKPTEEETKRAAAFMKRLGAKLPTNLEGK